MQKARELWDSIMTKGNAKYANMWLEYYNLERSVLHPIQSNVTQQMPPNCVWRFTELYCFKNLQEWMNCIMAS